MGHLKRDLSKLKRDLSRPKRDLSRLKKEITKFKAMEDYPIIFFTFAHEN